MCLFSLLGGLCSPWREEAGCHVEGCNPRFYDLPCSCRQLLVCLMPCAFPKQALQAPVWAKGSGEGKSIPEHGEEMQDCWISSVASSE